MDSSTRINDGQDDRVESEMRSDWPDHFHQDILSFTTNSASIDLRMLAERQRRTTPKRSSPNSCTDSYDQSGERELVITNFMQPERYRAARSGDIAFFRREFRSGNVELSSLKRATPRGDTLLHLAAHFAHDELVDLLLKHCPTLMESQNSTNVAPLHVAVSAGHLETVKKMLHCPETVLYGKKLLMEYCHEGNTLLHLALINRHEHVARFLFKEGNPQVAHYLNGQRKSPLHMAAESGYVTLFELMMKKSVGDQVDKIPDEVTKQYRSTLVRAAITGKSRGN